MGFADEGANSDKIGSGNVACATIRNADSEHDCSFISTRKPSQRSARWYLMISFLILLFGAACGIFYYYYSSEQPVSPHTSSSAGSDTWHSPSGSESWLENTMAHKAPPARDDQTKGFSSSMALAPGTVVTEKIVNVVCPREWVDPVVQVRAKIKPDEYATVKGEAVVKWLLRLVTLICEHPKPITYTFKSAIGLSKPHVAVKREYDDYFNIVDEVDADADIFSILGYGESEVTLLFKLDTTKIVSSAVGVAATSAYVSSKVGMQTADNVTLQTIADGSMSSETPESSVDRSTDNETRNYAQVPSVEDGFDADGTFGFTSKKAYSAPEAFGPETLDNVTTKEGIPGTRKNIISHFWSLLKSHGVFYITGRSSTFWIRAVIVLAIAGLLIYAYWRLHRQQTCAFGKRIKMLELQICQPFNECPCYSGDWLGHEGQ